MTPDNLDSLSLEELDEVFAQEVMGWPTPEVRGMESGDGITWRPCVAGPGFVHVMPPTAPPVSTSADAILPWLEKCQSYEDDYQEGTHSITLWVEGGTTGLIVTIAEAPTFPHAAAKALIRAERAKKGNV